MNQPLLIKVCGMREPANIQAIDMLGVDYIGFIFYPPSPRFMTTPPNLVPKTRTKKVGVFVNESIEKILDLAKRYQLQTIQLHGQEPVEYCLELKKHGFEIFKAIPVDEHTQTSDVKKYRGVCDYLLFDTKSPQHGGTGKKFDWNKLNELDSEAKFLLSGGMGAEDADLIKKISLKNLAGIDLNSRFELHPGFKDVTLLKTFINEIRRFD